MPLWEVPTFTSCLRYPHGPSRMRVFGQTCGSRVLRRAVNSPEELIRGDHQVFASVWEHRRCSVLGEELGSCSVRGSRDAVRKPELNNEIIWSPAHKAHNCALGRRRDLIKDFSRKCKK